MATTLWNFAGEDAEFLDPRRVFKPEFAGFWAEQDMPIFGALGYERFLPRSADLPGRALSRCCDRD